MSEKLHEWRGHVNEFMEISVTTLRKLSIIAEGLLKENAALVSRVEQLEHKLGAQARLLELRRLVLEGIKQGTISPDSPLYLEYRRLQKELKA